MQRPDPDSPLPYGVTDVDRECAERIRAGMLSAYEAFYHAQSPALYAFIRSLVRDAGAAEDLVQDSFIRVWDRRESLDPTKSLRAYLFTIAHHLALDYLRHQATNLRVTADLAVAEVSPAAQTPDSAEVAELSEAIDRAIAVLPDRMRTAFLLQWQQGLSYAQIADVMGVTRKTVENQLGRAIKLLRDALVKYRD